MMAGSVFMEYVGGFGLIPITVLRSWGYWLGDEDGMVYEVLVGDELGTYWYAWLIW